jgi:hypothetical protein
MRANVTGQTGPASYDFGRLLKIELLLFLLGTVCSWRFLACCFLNTFAVQHDSVFHPSVLPVSTRKHILIVFAHSLFGARRYHKPFGVGWT